MSFQLNEDRDELSLGLVPWRNTKDEIAWATVDGRHTFTLMETSNSIGNRVMVTTTGLIRGHPRLDLLRDWCFADLVAHSSRPQPTASEQRNFDITFWISGPPRTYLIQQVLAVGQPVFARVFAVGDGKMPDDYTPTWEELGVITALGICKDPYSLAIA